MARASDTENTMLAIHYLDLAMLIWPFVYIEFASDVYKLTDEDDPVYSVLRLIAMIKPESRLSMSITLDSCFDTCTQNLEFKCSL